LKLEIAFPPTRMMKNYLVVKMELEKGGGGGSFIFKRITNFYLFADDARQRPVIASFNLLAGLAYTDLEKMLQCIITNHLP
jgi:hypothetical protein